MNDELKKRQFGSFKYITKLILQNKRQKMC